MYNATINTFRSIVPIFNEIVNRFLSEPFKDQIQTLQSGKISVAYSRDFVRAQHEQWNSCWTELLYIFGLDGNEYLLK
jgi:hypothetical protein